MRWVSILHCYDNNFVIGTDIDKLNHHFMNAKLQIMCGFSYKQKVSVIITKHENFFQSNYSIQRPFFCLHQFKYFISCLIKHYSDRYVKLLLLYKLTMPTYTELNMYYPKYRTIHFDLFSIWVTLVLHELNERYNWHCVSHWLLHYSSTGES